MKDTDLAWLAGLLEGEGSFLKGPPSEPGTPRITVSMTDRDVVARVASLFGVSASNPFKHKNPKWKPFYLATLKGTRAVELMGLLRPLMGERRQGQIDRAAKTLSVSRRARLSDADVSAIRALLGQGLRICDVERITGKTHSLIGRIKRNKTYSVTVSRA